jgi:hypothetical protein
MWWHVVGVLVIVAVLAVVPAHHESATFVVAHFENQTGRVSTIHQGRGTGRTAWPPYHISPEHGIESRIVTSPE